MKRCFEWQKHACFIKIRDEADDWSNSQLLFAWRLDGYGSYSCWFPWISRMCTDWCLPRVQYLTSRSLAFPEDTDVWRPIIVNALYWVGALPWLFYVCVCAGEREREKEMNVCLYHHRRACTVFIKEQVIVHYILYYLNNTKLCEWHPVLSLKFNPKKPTILYLISVYKWSTWSKLVWLIVHTFKQQSKTPFSVILEVVVHVWK